jgi:hypothetical protein
MSGRAQGLRRGSDTASPAPIASGGRGAGFPGRRLGGNATVWPLPALTMYLACCSTAWPTSCTAKPAPKPPRSGGNFLPRSGRRCGARHGTSWPRFSPRSSGSVGLRSLTRDAKRPKRCMVAGRQLSAIIGNNERQPQKLLPALARHFDEHTKGVSTKLSTPFPIPIPASTVRTDQHA